MTVKPLEGQKALVTGGDSGIGAGLVIAFARAGAAVGINFHRNAIAADALAKTIRDEGGEVLLLKGDVAKEADVKRIFEKFNKTFGRIDILAANAGCAVYRRRHDVVSRLWRQRMTCACATANDPPP